MASRLDKNLFHLGKALGGQLPVVGPVIAALYEANQDLLLGELEKAAEGLSDDDVQRLATVVEGLETRVSSSVSKGMDQLDQHIGEAESTILGELELTKKVLLQAIEEAGNVEAKRRLEEQLRHIEEVRQSWIGRISPNQRFLLGLCGASKDHATARHSIFSMLRRQRPEFKLARYEEMNLRLHELRWLGLVGREQGDDDWYYWVTEAGHEVRQQVNQPHV